MALPATYARERTLSPARVGGLEIVFSPADPTFEVEIQRTVDNGAGAPNVGAAVSIVVLPPIPLTGSTYFDKLPVDGVKRFYRLRHTRKGWTDGAWSNWTAGKVPAPDTRGGKEPVAIGPGGIPRSYPFSDGKFALAAADAAGRELDDHVFIVSGKTLKVGTVAAPASLTKTLRVPHTELIPESSAQSWFVTNSFTRPNTANTVVVLRGALVLPKGVTIIAARARMYRQNSGTDSAACAVVRINDDGTNTALATINHSGTGWNTNASSVLSQLVGDDAYSIEVQLLGVSAVTDARFMWVELDYTMPSYDKGI